MPDGPARSTASGYVTWGELRPARRRARRRPRRRRAPAAVEGGRPTSTTAPSTWRRYVAAFKGGDGAGQHELPLRAGGDRLPVRQRRRRGRRVPRHVHRRCSRASATGCRRCRRWYVVADETGDGPGLGDAVRVGRRPAGADRVVAPWGRARRRPAAALHRRHDRHAEGRDVAPGRPVQRARRRRQPAARHPAGDATSRRSPARRDPARAPAGDARRPAR